MSARRNLWLFLPYQIASIEGLAHGLYVVWMIQEKHLAAETVAGVLASGDLLLMLLEVPTGRLADRFGHRGSLIAGSLIQVLGMALFWRGQGLLAMAASVWLIALGDAFRSGADQALLFQSCQQLGRSELFRPLLAISHALSIVGLAGLIALGGELAARFGLGFTLGAETALCSLGLLLALALAPVSAQADDEDEPRGSGWPSAETISTAILPAVIAGALLSCSELLLQASWSGPLVQLTRIIAGMAIAEAIGSALGARGGSRGLLAALGLASLGAALAAPVAPAASLWALALLTGWAHPLRAERIQLLAREGERAQAASWAGLADMAGSSLLLPLVAWLAARAGTGGALGGVVVALGAAWALAGRVARRRRDGLGMPPDQHLE